MRNNNLKPKALTPRISKPYTLTTCLFFERRHCPGERSALAALCLPLLLPLPRPTCDFESQGLEFRVTERRTVRNLNPRVPKPYGP